MTCPAHALAASRNRLTQEDVNCIRSLSSKLSPKAIVADVGAGSGTTALSVFAERDGDIKIISVDNDETELHWATQAVKNIGKEEFFSPIFADAIEAAKQFRSFYFDMLLVDISFNVREILTAWLPKLKAGAPVWIHDYGNPRDFGINQDPAIEVKLAVDKLLKADKLDNGRVAGLAWYGIKPSRKRKK